MDRLASTRRLPTEGFAHSRGHHLAVKRGRVLFSRPHHSAKQAPVRNAKSLKALGIGRRAVVVSASTGTQGTPGRASAASVVEAGKASITAVIIVSFLEY